MLDGYRRISSGASAELECHWLNLYGWPTSLDRVRCSSVVPEFTRTRRPSWQNGRVAEDGEPTELKLEFDWSDAADQDVRVATQFLVQIGVPVDGKPDGVYLIVGHANPPVIVSDDAKSRAEQVERYGGKLPVDVYGRYFLSRARLEELRGALDKLARTYDGLSEGGQP